MYKNCKIENTTGPKIKLCGMMKNEDIAYANEARPDYVGFVFAAARRMVTKEQAAGFREQLRDDIKAVGVFVDEDTAVVARLLERGIIDIVQLHGHEDADYIQRLKELTDKPIIKAVKVSCTKDIDRAASLNVDYLLLDTYRKGVPGGTGECFDWELIAAAKGKNSGLIGDKPFFLAGGLKADNIDRALHTGAYGLDISSGIEKNGSKDRELMLNIVNRIRNTQLEI